MFLKSKAYQRTAVRATSSALLFCSICLAIFLSPAVHAQRFVKVVNTIDDLVRLNPSDVHTNVFVADPLRGGLFTLAARTTTNRGTAFASTNATKQWNRQYNGVLNPKWFGATTSSSDASTELQDALTVSAGKTLQFDEIYYGKNLEVPASTKIIGKGGLKYPVNTGGFALLILSNNCTVDGIILDGNVANQSTWSEHRHCLWVKDSSNVTIRATIFTNIIGDGVMATHEDSAVAPYFGARNLNIIDNFFYGTSTNRNGVSVICGDGINISRNFFWMMGREGMPGAIDLEPFNTNQFVLNVTIEGNTIYGPTNATGNIGGQHAIAAADDIGHGRMERVKIRNNTITGNYLYPIHVAASTNNADSIDVTRNTITDLMYYGGENLARAISVRSTDGKLNATVAGNTIERVFGSGIWLDGGYVTVQGNTITNVQRHGIVVGALTKGTISGNSIFDAGKFNSSNGTRGGIYFETTGVSYTDNVIISGAATNSLFGFYSTTGTNNYFAGNQLSGVGTRNYEITGGRQAWGINFERSAGSAVDNTGTKDVMLFANATASEAQHIYFGGRTSGHVMIRAQDGVLRAVKGDDSAYAPFYGGDGSVVLGGFGATGISTTNLSVYGTNVQFGLHASDPTDPVRFEIGGVLAGHVGMVFLDGIARFIKGDDSAYAGVYGANYNAIGGYFNSDQLITNRLLMADASKNIVSSSVVPSEIAGADQVFINGVAVTNSGVDLQSQPIDITITHTPGVAPESAVFSFARISSPGSSPAMTANQATFGTAGILFEGTTANSSEGQLDAAALSADRQWTLPDKDGVVALTSTAIGITNINNTFSAVIEAGTNVVLTTNGNAIVVNVATNTVDTDGYTLLPIVTTTDGTLTPIFTNSVANNAMITVHAQIDVIKSDASQIAHRTIAFICVNEAGALTGSTSYPSQHNVGADSSQWVVDDNTSGTSYIVTVQNNSASPTDTLKWQMRYKVITHAP